MRCTHCRNTMDQTDQVVELHTRQTWYRCPVCNSEHTTSERTERRLPERMGSGLRFGLLAPHSG